MLAIPDTYSDYTEGRKSQPIGFCIYCYTHQGPLSDEHTLPDGMGGRHILVEASCARCQAEINTFEQYCMRTLLGNIRAHHRIRSSKRSRRNRPPVPQSVLAVEKETQTQRRIYRPIEDLPLVAALPALPPPFALSNIPAPSTFRGGMWTPSYPSADFLQQVGADSVRSEKINIGKFARFLAKIAHTTAVESLGFDVFDPVLPPLILGQHPRVLDYVGGSLKAFPRSQSTHLIGVYSMPRFDGVEYVMGYIRLFGSLQAPVYHVVVGKLRAKWPNP